MSVALAKLVGKAEDEVAKFVSAMEDRFGNPSEDVRLVAETKQAAVRKIADLGLDPLDTTAEELYHALRVKFIHDSETIDRESGINGTMNFSQRLARAEELIKAIQKQAVWAVKPAVLRSLLRANPPKKTITLLNYRSLESMLKRENPAEVLLAAEYFETALWHSSLAHSAKNLTASDYEQRPINYAILTSRQCQGDGPVDLVMISRLAGSVSIWPDIKLKHASGLHLMLLLLKATGRLDYKIGVKSSAQLSQALGWWADTNYLVSVHDGQKVSFNPQDVASNLLHGNGHKDAIASHGERSLWNELASRYAQIIGEDIAKIDTEIVERAKRITVPTPAQLAEDMVNI